MLSRRMILTGTNQARVRTLQSSRPLPSHERTFVRRCLSTLLGISASFRADIPKGATVMPYSVPRASAASLFVKAPNARCPDAPLETPDERAPATRTPVDDEPPCDDCAPWEGAARYRGGGCGHTRSSTRRLGGCRYSGTRAELSAQAAHIRPPNTLNPTFPGRRGGTPLRMGLWPSWGPLGKRFLVACNRIRVGRAADARCHGSSCPWRAVAGQTPDTRRPSGGSGGAPGDVGQRRQVLRRRHRASLEAAHLAGGRGQVQHRAPSDHPGHRGIAPEPIGVIHVLVAGETRTPLGGIGRAACGARSFPVRGSRRMNRTGSSRPSVVSTGSTS